MHCSAALGLVVVALLATPVGSAAAGDDTVPSQPSAEAAAGRMSVSVQRALTVGTGRFAIARQRLRVLGRVRPYVEGETVEVRFSRRGRAVKVVTAPVLPSRRAGRGVFSVEVTVGRIGRLGVRAVHRESPRLRAFSARTRAVEVVPRLRYTARSALVGELQKGLQKLGYTVRPTGTFDTRTTHAVRTWRRIAGVGRGFSASPAVVRGVLRGRGAFRARYPRHGRHLEADLSRGVLALLDGAKVVRLVAMSPGHRSTPTITGSFTFGRKEPGLNSVQMLHSNYFQGGYAVHGYSYVPDFPSSHGCLRIPNADAAEVDRFIRVGDRIDIYP